MSPSNTAHSVLVVDDESAIRDTIELAFQREGYRVTTAENGEKALKLLETKRFDLLITDLKMIGLTGLELLGEAKKRYPEAEVVVMTGYGSIEGAVVAIKAGAYDYVTKPFRHHELLHVATRALEHKGLTQRLRELEEQVDRQNDGIIASSPPMKQILKIIKQVAKIDSTVLVTGESGTGKELVAKALHHSSDRREKQLVIVNCGAIPENLQESELFGHTKGAFTGAHADRRGMCVQADGGTLFLDEIADLAPVAQVKILRFLQEGEVRAIGAGRTQHVDVRVIAATNQDLERAVADGRFREDLFYRLNVIPIYLPPLRERRDDIPALVQSFVRLSAARMDKTPAPTVSPAAMKRLEEQPWKGNVRELENVIERATAFDHDGVLGLDDLPFERGHRSEDRLLGDALSRRLSLSQLEREYILEVLAQEQGSRKKTAERLGITTATLWRKLKQYEHEREFS